MKLKRRVGRDKSLAWFRYIFDVFLIWTHREKEIHKFIEDLDNYQPNIKIIYIFSKTCVPFLDLRVHLSKFKIIINLHIKSTYRQQHLRFLLSRSNHAKSSVIYIHAPTISRISFKDSYFRKHLLEMKTWLLGQGCAKKIVESKMKNYTRMTKFEK